MRKAIPYLLLIPILTLLSLLILIPEIWALFLSLTEYAPGKKPIYVGLKNYVEIIRDPAFWNALLNNIIFVSGAVFFEFLVGLGSALLLNHRFPLQRLWVSLLVAPYAISPVVACVIWIYILNPSYGIVNYILSLFRIQPVSWFGSIIPSFIAIIIVDAWKYYPFIMIIAYSALTSLPQEIFEAASIDGTTGWQSFRYITFPLITPALLVALTFRLIFALRTFGIIWILTEGGPSRGTEILSVYLYKESFRYFNFGRGSTIAVFMLIMTTLFSIFVIRETYKRMFL